MAAPVVLLAAVLGGGLLALSRKKKSTAAPEVDPDLEAKMIGTEIAALPEVSRMAIMKLLIGNDPADTGEIYMSSIAQLNGFGTFPFTIRKLTERAKDRFG